MAAAFLTLEGLLLCDLLNMEFNMLNIVMPVVGAGPGGLGTGFLVPMLIIVGIFYFMMIRPQQRKDRARKKMIEELRAGARVLFSGGIVGIVSEAREHTFLVKIAEGVEIEVARGAVLRVLKDGEIAVTEDAR